MTPNQPAQSLRPAQQDAIGLRQKIGCSTLLSPSAQKVVLNFLFFKAGVFFLSSIVFPNSRTHFCLLASKRRGGQLR
jgi:hypothetical protein